MQNIYAVTNSPRAKHTIAFHVKDNKSNCISYEYKTNQNTWRYPASRPDSSSKTNLVSCNLCTVNCITKYSSSRNSSSPLFSLRSCTSFTKQGNHILQVYWLHISTANVYSHSVRVTEENKLFKSLGISGASVIRRINERKRWKIRMPKLLSSPKILITGAVWN